MKIRILAVLLIVAFSLPGRAAAGELKEKKEKPPTPPIGWLYLRNEALDFSGQTFDLHKITRKIPRGSLIPVFKTKQKDGGIYGRVASLNLDTGFAEQGWVLMDPKDMKPADAFPPDDDLVPLLGTPYLEDVMAKHTDMARFLVRQAHGDDLLLCYVLTGQLMMAKLAVFSPKHGKFVLGATMDIPMAEVQSGVSSIEIRDLVGDGSDCIITKESFHNLTDTSGSNLFIRRVVGDQFNTVWQAPIKFKNLSQYRDKLHILQPPESNIGAPGTVTTGDVTYKPAGKGETPAWKGKVEFFIINREMALDSVEIEKACPWNGTEFAPIR